MSILNRRNAILGWATWQAAKVAAKHKAKQAAPGRVDNSRRPNKAAILSALAAVGGAVWFWRRTRSEEDS